MGGLEKAAGEFAQAGGLQATESLHVQARAAEQKDSNYIEPSNRTTWEHAEHGIRYHQPDAGGAPLVACVEDPRTLKGSPRGKGFEWGESG
jgi:hypothetical protein